MKPLSPLGTVAALACLLAAGCLESTSPLSDPVETSPDKRLVGVWRHDQGDGRAYYHVGFLGRKAPAGVLRVVVVAHAGSGELSEPRQAICFPTESGGNSYLNLAGAEQEQISKFQKEGWKPSLLDSYLIAKYRIEGDALLVWPMDSDAMKKAIEAGRIKGEFKERRGEVLQYTEARFTDTTDNLVNLLNLTGDDLFQAKPLRFERVR